MFTETLSKVEMASSTESTQYSSRLTYGKAAVEYCSKLVDRYYSVMSQSPGYLHRLVVLQVSFMHSVCWLFLSDLKVRFFYRISLFFYFQINLY